jgi:hypothetical protein
MSLDKPHLADTRPALDIESIIDEAEPAQTAVTICVKGSLKAEYERLETQFADVGNAVTNLAGGGPGSEIAARMVELREQMKTYERTFTLRAVIPRRAWRNLQAKRPVKTPDMDADAYGDVYHPWVCSVVAASAVDPAMTPEQVERFADRLSDGDWGKLANAAWKVNDSSSEIPFSVAASVLSRSSGAKSKQPEPSTNPDPGSLAGSPPSEPPSNATPADESLAG